MGKMVFLISDQKWQDVLSLVPISIWTELPSPDSSASGDVDLPTFVGDRPIRPVHKVPTLVYHEEANGIDVGSILHFLRSYLGRSSEATIVHIGSFPAGLPTLLDGHLKLQDLQIQKVESVRALQAKEDGIDTWVIVARGDYRSGLVAAPFASLHHALLFFLDAGNRADYERMNAAGKKVYLIGDIDEQVKEHFGSQAETLECHTCEEIQQLYLAETKTDRIILVNPDDREAEIEEDNPSLCDSMLGEIHRFYGGTSLAAPFLAAAKHELILPVSSTNPCTIDYFLDRFVSETKENLGIGMQYLTIMASPEAIPMAISIGEHRTRSDDVWVELDGRHYASLGQNEAEVDLAVGRIFGITISDCSAYVARALFYDDLHRQPDRAALLIMTEGGVCENGGPVEISTADDIRKHMTNRYWTPEVEAQFDDPPWEYLGEEARGLRREASDPNQVEKVKRFRERYQKATLILYIGHADCNGVRGIIDTTEPYYRNMYLNFPVVIGAACNTGAYEWIKRDQRCRPGRYKLTNLFVAQNIRRGAMGQQCAVSYAYWHEECDKLLHGLYVDGLSLGEAFQQAKNAEFNRHRGNPDYNNATCDKIWGDAHYVLVGDPTFRPKRDSQ
jgi:hypothetical protein